MILVEHGNMWFIGSGYASEVEHLMKCIVETICIGSVNAFVLISGWFGIRNGLSKIGDLAFMLLFCTVPLLFLALVSGWVTFSDISSLNGIYEFVFGGNNYWFVADYIGLLIIAPLLNRGIESCDEKQCAALLMSGYILIGIYDFVFKSPVIGAEGGYSVIWFAYLYLLARYLRKHGIGYVEKYKWPLLVLAITLQSCLFYLGLIGLRYTNPFIIIESICLIVIFKDWNFQNRAINLAAKGCLMAYLIHMQPILVPFIGRFLSNEYHKIGYFPYMLEVLILAIGVFAVAVPLNQLQSSLYQKIRKCW